MQFILFYVTVLRPQRICSYFDQTNILADSRNSPDLSDGYSLDVEDGYDYQDNVPVVQLLNNKSAVNVRNGGGTVISWRGNNLLSNGSFIAFQSETIVCEKNENYCYTLWSFNGKQNVTFNKQGRPSNIPFTIPFLESLLNPFLLETYF